MSIIIRSLWVLLMLIMMTGPGQAKPKSIRVPAAPRLPKLTSPRTHAATTPAATPSVQGGYNWAAPAAALPTIHLYDGQDAAKAGLFPVSWGGGSGAITSEVAYVAKGRAIKIVTRGLYEGARINFEPAVDLGDRSRARNRVFQLLIRFADTSSAPADQADAPAAATPATGTAETRPEALITGGRPFQPIENAVYTPSRGGFFRLAQFPQGYPGVPPPRRAGPRLPAGMPSGIYIPGVSGTRPTEPAPAAPAPSPGVAASDDWTPPFQNIRIRFTLANGAEAEVLRPVPPSGAFEDPVSAWRSIGVPLSALKFPEGQENSPLSSITIGADGNATVYVGQINLVDDATPIVCTAGTDKDVASGDETTFEAEVRAGASMVRYSWDFDASDGIMNESDQRAAPHTYAVGNKDYIATLTVSDIDGIKQPCVSKVTVKVEE